MEKIQSFIPLALIASLILMSVLEYLIPFFEHKTTGWRHKINNLAMVFLFFIVSGVAGTGTSALVLWAEQTDFGLLNLISLPIAYNVVIGFVLCDLVNWTAHWLKHKVSFLWKFHKVHHSDSYMNFTTSLRNHPLEAFINAVIASAGYVLLGISPFSIVLYTLVLMPVLVISHSNIALPTRVDKWLILVFVTPNYHKVHHSEFRLETDSNFSDLFTIWDRIFRTFKFKKNLKELSLGLGEFSEDKNLWQLLKRPFLK